jgi:hypothetical protein
MDSESIEASVKTKELGRYDNKDAANHGTFEESFPQAT